MQRDAHSHKGETGKVAIIGGSRHMHGAPLFSALAAEASGVDLLYVFVPPAHEEVAKQASYNFQVRTFRQDELSADDVAPVLRMLASMDCAVIGPGLAREHGPLNALQQIVTGAPCPLVLDASALQPDTINWLHGKTAVLTPHLGELERMRIHMDDASDICSTHGITMLIKGSTDHIIGPHGETHTVKGGNPGLTVGGTGDALAGLIAGLMAQKLAPIDAAQMASACIKHAADMLHEQQGYAYTTRDVIDVMPMVLQLAKA